MASPVIQNNFRARKTFAKIAKIIDIPNLIDIQKQSYEKFLQKDTPLDKRVQAALHDAFKQKGIVKADFPDDVREDVAVGVTCEAFGVVNGKTADDQRHPGLEGVGVKAETDSHTHRATPCAR